MCDQRNCRKSGGYALPDYERRFMIDSINAAKAVDDLKEVLKYFFEQHVPIVTSED